jgi:ribonuclease P protein component
MLPIENRLKDRRDFSSVYENGKFFSFNGVAVRFVATNLPVCRVGFSVGKNFSKSAVVRNRIRRLLRELFRLRIAHLKPGFDIVVSYGSKMKNPKIVELSQTMDHILERCHLLT